MTSEKGVPIQQFLQGLEREGLPIPPGLLQSPNILDDNKLQEYATDALNRLRGLSKEDKEKVIRQMGKIIRLKGA